MSTERTAILTGTGYEGRDKIIKRHCREGLPVVLKREPRNEYDENAIAAYLVTPKLFGLLGNSKKMIGYIKANTAKSLAKKMDAGSSVTGEVKSYYAPENRDHPRVTVYLDIE